MSVGVKKLEECSFEFVLVTRIILKFDSTKLEKNLNYCFEDSEYGTSEQLLEARFFHLSQYNFPRKRWFILNAIRIKKTLNRCNSKDSNFRSTNERPLEAWNLALWNELWFIPIQLPVPEISLFKEKGDFLFLFLTIYCLRFYIRLGFFLLFLPTCFKF